MADREMLELAAKAAGINGKWLRKASSRPTARNPSDVVEGFVICNPRGGQGKHWNPLTDDGDEARLEAVMGFNVEWRAAQVRVSSLRGGAIENYADHGNDKQKARRHAGVRAAAEIGRGM